MTASSVVGGASVVGVVRSGITRMLGELPRDLSTRLGHGNISFRESSIPSDWTMARWVIGQEQRGPSGRKAVESGQPLVDQLRHRLHRSVRRCAKFSVVGSASSPRPYRQAPPEQSLPALQKTPQAPQFVGSRAMSTHRFKQRVSPGPHGAEQVPVSQNELAEQALPQRPQCSCDVFRSTHAPEHSEKPASHPGTQVPAAQWEVAEQALPQRPQCCGCVRRSAQRPPQLTSWSPHGMGRQAPREHSSPKAQATPQAPQCCRSLCRLTQAALQEEKPGGQGIAEQTPS